MEESPWKTDLKMEERLERLERENRLLKRMMAGAFAVGALSFLLGAAAVRTVEAERFLLKDGAGRVRLSLGSRPDGLACVLYDVKGKPGMRMGINDDGTLGFQPGGAPPAKATQVDQGLK